MRTMHKALTKGARTAAQTLAGILAASGAGVLDADWIGALSASGMAGLIAVLMNLGDSDQTADNETATS